MPDSLEDYYAAVHAANMEELKLRRNLAEHSLKVKLEAATSTPVLAEQVKILQDMLAEAYKKIDKLETVIHRIKGIIE